MTMKGLDKMHRTRSLVKKRDSLRKAAAVLLYMTMSVSGTVISDVTDVKAAEPFLTEDSELSNCDMYESMLFEISKQTVLNENIADKKFTDMEKERAYTRMKLDTGMYVADDQEAYIEQAETIEISVVNADYSYLNNGDTHITPDGGVYHGPSGKETYYNLPMGGVIYLMRHLGYSEEEYPYWIRDDGVKMFGDYVMVAADLSIRPKGTILESSMGTAIVCDTGDLETMQLDIAVNW